MRKESRILITGGAGFIGRAIARRLKNKSFENIIIFDNFSTGSRDYIPSGCVVIEGDIRNNEDLKNLPKDIEYIFHLAAATSVEESFAKPKFYLENNVYGTINILEWALTNKIKKIVYSSSGAIYGSVGDSVIMKEDLMPNPNNYYGLTKLDGEHLINMCNLNFGLDFAILRYFNVFGESQECTSPYASVIPKFIYAAINGNDLTVYGTGEQTRDFIHVEEIADASILAMEKGSGIYNVATGEQEDVNSIAKLILKRIKTKSKIVYLSPVPGDSMRDNGCNKKLISLGWQKSKSFEDRLEDVIEWYQAHIPTPESTKIL